jgi:hypothetical protein
MTQKFTQVKKQIMFRFALDFFDSSTPKGEYILGVYNILIFSEKLENAKLA